MSIEPGHLPFNTSRPRGEVALNNEEQWTIKASKQPWESPLSSWLSVHAPARARRGWRAHTALQGHSSAALNSQDNCSRPTLQPGAPEVRPPSLRGHTAAGHCGWPQGSPRTALSPDWKCQSHHFRPALQCPGKSKYKSHRLGGENRFSSFITAHCQAGFQLNFSCALRQALLFPEISPGLKRLPRCPAPGLYFLTLLLQLQHCSLHFCRDHSHTQLSHRALSCPIPLTSMKAGADQHPLFKLCAFCI